MIKCQGHYTKSGYNKYIFLWTCISHFLHFLCLPRSIVLSDFGRGTLQRPDGKLVLWSTMISCHTENRPSFFSHRGTTAVYDFSIFQLSFSKIMKLEIKRIDKHSSFLLFYVSIRRQITRIIVLSLLSRLHEIALLSIRSNINFPILHQTMTEKMGNLYVRKRSNVVILT